MPSTGGDFAPDTFFWSIWRPVVSPGCSVNLRELEEYYSVDDLLDLHEAMDMRENMLMEVYEEIAASLKSGMGG
ncbi:MAG: hypothetical protein M0Q12_00085 [Synergistaceae bacterium]|jgi:hypothetical protein|nr:hypothetical protein [Synergistaceae bacterium]